MNIICIYVWQCTKRSWPAEQLQSHSVFTSYQWLETFPCTYNNSGSHLNVKRCKCSTRFECLINWAQLNFDCKIIRGMDSELILHCWVLGKKKTKNNFEHPDWIQITPNQSGRIVEYSLLASVESYQYCAQCCTLTSTKVKYNKQNICSTMKSLYVRRK